MNKSFDSVITLVREVKINTRGEQKMKRTKAQIERDIKAGVKVCSKCKNELPMKAFALKNTSVDGRASTCRECFKGSKSRRYRRSEEELKHDLDTETKVCTKCGDRLPFKEFHLNKRNVDGLDLNCKSCRAKLYDANVYRSGNLIRTYGITIDEYNSILEKQGGVCKICGGVDKHKSLAVDHNHTSGEVRGLLCERCNRGIGLLQDSEVLLRRAADYLSLP